MKQIIVLTTVLLLTLGMTGTATAGVHVFNPDPANMYNLDHFNYYTWGMEWTAQNERIDEVILTFNDIRNWWPYEDNSLFIHLIDDPSLGLYQGEDLTLGIVDYFDGQGVLVDAWSDPVGGYTSDGVTLSYSFKDLGLLDVFASYAAGGTFGFGMDPDCHYYNSGVQLTVITDTPEPATFLLFGLGLTGAGLIRRRRSR